MVGEQRLFLLLNALKGLLNFIYVSVTKLLLQHNPANMRGNILVYSWIVFGVTVVSL